jgi:multiple sugar transport system permease protein
LLRPALIAAGLFRLIDSFKAFPLIFVMTGGGPGVATEPTNYYAYTQAFNQTFIGYSSAMIVVMLAVTIVLSAIILRLPGLADDAD